MLDLDKDDVVDTTGQSASLQQEEDPQTVGGDAAQLTSASQARITASSGLFCRAARHLDAGDFEASVTHHAITMPYPVTPTVTGFVPFNEPSECEPAHYVLAHGGYLAARMFHLSRTVPKAAMARKLRDEFAKKPNLNASDKLMLEADCFASLLGQALVTETESVVIYHAASGLLFIGERSLSQAEASRARLERLFPQLGPKRIRFQSTVSTTMTKWLFQDEAPAGFSFGQAIKLLGEKGVSANLKKHKLQDMTVMQHIKAGQKADEVEFVAVDQEFSLVMCNEGFFKRIGLKVGGRLVEQSVPTMRERVKDFADALFPTAAALLQAAEPAPPLDLDIEALWPAEDAEE